MKKQLFVFISILFSSLNIVLGQEIKNIRATENQGKVTIAYDLIGLMTHEKYKIEIYSSVDNFKSPLTFTTGDLGNNVEAGLNKQIVWDARKALKEFKGKVSFEIKGSPANPVIFTNKFEKSYKIKNGIEVKYNGLVSYEHSYFLLTNKKDSLRLDPSPTKNNTSMLVIPKNTKGGTYKLKLINPVDKQIVISPNLRINKGRMAIKIIVPVAILGAAAGAYFIFKPHPTSTTEADLPLPINP